MSKKKKKDKKAPEAKAKINIPFGIKNWVILVACMVLFFNLKNANAGYTWVFDTLLKSNLKMMKENPNLSHETKLEAKLGVNYKFLDYVVKNTPTDAVIIMPPKKVFLPEGQKSNFTVYVTRKGWSQYFVHPRTLVYEDEKDEYLSKYNSATHVAIVNGWGYDKINYPISQKPDIAVFPINK